MTALERLDLADMEERDLYHDPLVQEHARWALSQ